MRLFLANLGFCLSLTLVGMGRQETVEEDSPILLLFLLHVKAELSDLSRESVSRRKLFQSFQRRHRHR